VDTSRTQSVDGSHNRAVAVRVPSRGRQIRQTPMRRVALLTLALTCVVPGLALARLRYRDGIYNGGDLSAQNYLHGTKPILTLWVTKGVVQVTALRFTDHCSNGKHTFVGFGSLTRGDPFNGPIKPSGRFVATYPHYGKTTVSGTLGSDLTTVMATDEGPLPSNPKVICRGSHRFWVTMAR
jgi:hypothetical protein